MDDLLLRQKLMGALQFAEESPRAEGGGVLRLRRGERRWVMCALGRRRLDHAIKKRRKKIKKKTKAISVISKF